MLFFPNIYISVAQQRWLCPRNEPGSLLGSCVQVPVHLTHYFQVCVASTSAHIIFSRAYSLGLSYRNSHYSSLCDCSCRRGQCAHSTLLNLQVHTLHLYSGVWGEAIQMSSNTRSVGLIVKSPNCLNPGFSSLICGSWSIATSRNSCSSQGSGQLSRVAEKHYSSCP